MGAGFERQVAEYSWLGMCWKNKKQIQHEKASRHFIHQLRDMNSPTGLWGAEAMRLEAQAWFHSSFLRWQESMEG